ncbi:hypothetical protein DFJ74DRAFT_649482 [Hyaloraphidium curvatum]|nr:hypothetical protein DFJ74DRAFT_649482 [Hyaloraphidium curvatum]
MDDQVPATELQTRPAQNTMGEPPHPLFEIEDLVVCVLERLDAPSTLGRAESVCRTWQTAAGRAWLAHLKRRFGGPRLAAELEYGGQRRSAKHVFRERLQEERRNLADLSSSMLARVPDDPIADFCHGIHRDVLSCRSHPDEYRVSKRFLVWRIREIIEKEEDFAAANPFSGRLRRVMSCVPTEHPLIFVVSSPYRRFYCFSETGEPMDEDQEGIFTPAYAGLFDLVRRRGPPALRPDLADSSSETLLDRLLKKERTILAAFPNAIAESLWPGRDHAVGGDDAFVLARRYVFANSYLSVAPLQAIGPDEELPDVVISPYLEPQHFVGKVEVDAPGSHELAYVLGGIGLTRGIVIKDTGALIRSRIGLPGRLWRALLKRSNSGELMDHFRERLPYFAIVERENFELDDGASAAEVLNLIRFEG